MKKVIALNPFNDFWINCQSRNILSVLTTANPSYRTAAMMNNYTYGTGGRSGWYKSLTIDYNENERTFLGYVDRIKYDFDLNRDCLDEIKDKINENRLISVMVDLYYWNPSSVLYHMTHSKHFSMCFGYDDEEECLYFDEEMVNDDGFLKVSYDRFREALYIENGRSFEIESLVKSDIKDYNYSISDVIINASKICESIREIFVISPWSDFGKSEDISMEITDMTKLYHRQVANIGLFGCLKVDGYITNEQYEYYKSGFEEIERIWRSLHNITYKAAIKKHGIDSFKSNEIGEKALRAEYKLWDEFINDMKFEKQKPIYLPLQPQSRYIPVIIGDELNSKEVIYKSDIKIEEIRFELNIENEYTCILYIKYESVIGGLTMHGNGGEWKLVSCEDAFNGDMHGIVEIIGTTIKLYTEMPWKDNTLKKYFKLSYYSTYDDYICDDVGNIIPNLYNLVLQERRPISPFISKVITSNPISLDEIPFCEIIYSEIKDKLKWQKRVSDNFLIAFPHELCSEETDSGIFYKFFINTDQEVPMYLHFSFIDEQFVLLNSNIIAKFPARDVKYHSYAEKIPLELNAGCNEIVIFTHSKYGKADRIALRLEGCCKVDDNGATEWMPEVVFNI